MKKLLLSVAIVSFNYIHAQNYFGTEFIGEEGVNSPQGFTKKGNKLVLSSSIGGGLTGNFPISFKGGNADGILTSLNATDGTIEWIKQFGGGGDEVIIDTAIDDAGNYYVTGYMTGGGSSAMDADPGPGVYLLPIPSALSNRDIFIVKLDANGNFLWAKQMSTPSGAGNEEICSIKLDSNGNIYLAGFFITVDFDPSPLQQLYVASGNADAFIVKLTSDGDFIWVKTFGSDTGKISGIKSMDIDESDNIYVAGRFQGSIDLDPDLVNTDIKTSNGGYDTYLAKYTSEGNYVWGKTYGGKGNDIPEKILLAKGNLYVGGSFSGEVDLDPSPANSTYSAPEGQQAYVSKFDIDGSYLKSFVMEDNTANPNTIKDVFVDDKENIYLSGLFQNMTINATNYSTPYANADTFFLKLDQNMNFSSIYLIQGVGKQSVPYINQLTDTKFITAGASKQNADFDYTTETSPEVPTNAQIYTHITKLDFEKNDLGMVEVKGNKQIDVFPNPVVDIIHITSQNKLNVVSIYNLEGKTVMKQDKFDLNQINVSFLPKGVYLLQATDEKGNIHQAKFIKK
ncbi:T9SS type A sorting domain-containing protein [Empedobacter brevis]|uniref:T9SS type A sorting domain-containing protein n=1 Tax=Empedobacter brevis TaxID=247 RepID=UPI0023F1DB27|nr:T9SS type A sorting domain-containing protein [Empedobacter brevis]